MGFVFSHQTLIIEGIFATILAVIVVWLFTNLQDENNSNSHAETQEIKKMLKQALEANPAGGIPQAPTKPADGAKAGADAASASKSAATTPQPQTATIVSSPIIPLTPTASTPTTTSPTVTVKPAATIVEAAPPPTSTPTPTPVAPTPIVSPAPVIIAQPDPAETLKLKNDIENRNKKVDELEAALRQAKEDLAKMQDTSKNTDTLEALRKQIATLEGRLKEYAIIEDDIANLSAYKDENEKLKTELALLKKKGPKPEAQELSVVPKAPKAEITQAPPPSPVAEESGPTWPINEGESKKLLNEFDTLMNTQNASPAEEIIDQSNAGEGEKLIAEFQDFMKGIG